MRARRMIATTAVWLFVHGCADVKGGAVELSWKFRPRSSAVEDKFVECNSGRAGTGPIARMQLVWDVEGMQGTESWPCDDSHGVTGFELPPGQALLTVIPVCNAGQALPDSYIAPAAEQRAVIVGDTVSLGAIELIVQVSECEEAACICE